jgi:hypothetical protein
MISTKRVTAMAEVLTCSDPTALVVNVLANTSEWKGLSPYHLRTDGAEIQRNPGGVLFENFWQGSKVYREVFPIEVYSHASKRGDPRFLYWRWQSHAVHLADDGSVNLDAWHAWRDSLWAAAKPVRYPNGFARRTECKFALLNDVERLGYIDARKRLYFAEYIRLARRTAEYARLLDAVRAGRHVCIGEIDVPAPGKRGTHNSAAAEVQMTLPYLQAMLDDESEPFGHGLCLAWALLTDAAAA